MALVLLKSDDVSPATGLVFTANAGAESATQTFHLWFSKGTPGGSISDVFLQLEVDNGSGTYVTSGVAACDQHWFKARVASGSNPSNDPAFILQTTDWFDVGSNAVLPIPDLVGNSARYIEIKLRAPLGDGAATTTSNFRFVPRYAEAAFGVPGGLAEEGNGILTGVGDLTASEFVEAPTVTQSAVPDDYVNVSRRWWIRNGVSLRAWTDAHQLNQSDSAAAALVAGEAYMVTISQGPAGVPTYTKGVKAVAASAVAPAAPAGEIVIGTVKVRYQAVTTNIITSDITVLAFSGRFRPQTSTGLALTINPGRAVLSGAFVRRTSQQTAVLTASVTNRIWLSASGGLVVTSSSTVPQAGVILLATAVTDGSGVTSLTDLRDGKYHEPNAQILQLYTSDAEPTTLYPELMLRERVSIAAAASTDSSIQIPANSQVIAVEVLVITQPGTTATLDVGVAGATTRYAAGISSVAGTLSTGLLDGQRGYAAAAAIRITPNAVPSDAAGVVEVTIRYRLGVSAAASSYARTMVPFPWNLDRVVASVRTASSGGATGSTTFAAFANSTALTPSAGSEAIIAAGSRVSAAGSEGYPTVTTGASGDLLGARITTVTAGGTPASGMAFAFIMYPLIGGTA